MCHSLTRELEVLHDRLLALMAGPDPPQPGDILVVTPDLDAAAPLIDAVFGTAPRERHLPYTISGRARAQVNAPARALLDALALLASRFAVNNVFGLLQQPVVARRFGLAEDDLDQVRDWLVRLRHPLGARRRAPRRLRRAGAGAPQLRRRPRPPVPRLRAARPAAGAVPGPAAGRRRRGLGRAHAGRVLALRRRAEGAARPRRAPAPAGRLARASWPTRCATFVAPADAELEDLREVDDGHRPARRPVAPQRAGRAAGVRRRARRARTGARRPGARRRAHRHDHVRGDEQPAQRAVPRRLRDRPRRRRVPHHGAARGVRPDGRWRRAAAIASAASTSATCSSTCCSPRATACT